ncbi:MAG: flagellar basal body-associated FliL family protein [Desulfobacteraceae bacterium]|nr:flagellar basal body-associated FliL family protein [Desulfobacteraceae bacterium]
MMKKIKYLFSALLLLSVLFSCSGSGDLQDPFTLSLIDDWRFSYRRSMIIMSIKANGNWESQVRQMGHFSEVVQKKGLQRGTWELAEKNKYLKITVETGDEIETGWEPGNTYQYLISSLTEEKLVLVKEDSGAETEWLRIKGKKSAAASSADGAPLITEQKIDLDPLIVNLKKRTPYSKDRQICISLSVIETLEKPARTTEEMPEPLPVHPSLRDNLVFYFSSLEYNEIKNFTKVKDHIKSLEKIINPYFKGRLKELKLNNIIVAGSRGSLEEFIIQYPDQMERFNMIPSQPEQPPEQ